jgi:prepilin-type N-terminal cleavage/methylation domain-containing protein
MASGRCSLDPVDGEAGFSLVEMLVALMIVALTSSLVVLNLPAMLTDPARTFERQVQDATLQLQREALIAQKPHALRVTPAALERLVWTGKSWRLEGRRALQQSKDCSIARDAASLGEATPHIVADPAGLLAVRAFALRCEGRATVEFNQQRLLNQDEG